ncbi:AAA family ATPase [Shewanella glacialipiscicola]|jgi:cellulose biosynthesis protein BcsQ|uniref:AAA family ATPase n=1 Tax=Shewanella glacialipiscicola TaxID=614069 RepID=UPI003D79BB75
MSEKQFTKKMIGIADRARKVLTSMSESVSNQKIEFETDTFHLRYSKGAVGNLPLLTRKIVEKSMREMEAEGYQFSKKMNGSVEVYDLPIGQVIDIYKHRKITPLRKKFNRGLVLFICNLKGGVSKTVSTVNIAHSLRCHPNLLQHDLRILILDGDPQSSASMFLNHKHAIGTVDNTTIQAILADLTREELLEHFVLPTQIQGVDMIPASIADGFIAEQWVNLCKEQFGNDVNPWELFKKNVTNRLINDYDLILIDCGPHLDSILKSTLCATDILITPLPPTTVDLHSTFQYIERLPQIIDDLERSGAEINILGHLAYMTRFSHTEQDNDSSMIANAVFGEDLMLTNIPELSAFKRCAETFDTVISVHPDNYTGDSRSLKKARTAIDAFSLTLFQHISRLRGV